MTCIAWDGKTLAADKRASNSGLSHTTTKIFRIGNELVGFSGDASSGRELLEWYRAGAVVTDFPQKQRDNDEGRLLVIRGGGVIVYEKTPYPIHFEDEIFATGSGRDYAMAAMHLGCSAEQAVKVACHFDTDCGNGIDVLELQETIRAVA